MVGNRQYRTFASKGSGDHIPISITIYLHATWHHSIFELYHCNCQSVLCCRSLFGALKYKNHKAFLPRVLRAISLLFHPFPITLSRRLLRIFLLTFLHRCILVSHSIKYCRIATMPCSPFSSQHLNYDTMLPRVFIGVKCQTSLRTPSLCNPHTMARAPVIERRSVGLWLVADQAKDHDSPGIPDSMLWLRSSSAVTYVCATSAIKQTATYHDVGCRLPCPRPWTDSESSKETMMAFFACRVTLL
jgi:hypothetical protein